jgi:hypothetical protein
MKGHGVLTWTLPTGRDIPVEQAAHSPPLGDISWMEHRLAQFLTR